MALNGRAGQRFSQAPHPMQRSSLMAGIFGLSARSGSEDTIVMAPVGQCRAQLPHATPSVSGTQLSRTQTARPTCMADFSAGVIFRMAPAGQTSEQTTHYGRQ